MKARLTFLIIFLSVLFVACKKSDLQYENEFDRSYKAFESFKASTNNSYRYTVSASTWTGSSWQTTISVKQGIIVGRNFSYTRFGDVQKPQNGWTTLEADQILQSLGTTAEEFLNKSGFTLLEALEWTETEGNLGKTSRNSPAYSLLTLDDIYNKARTEWLVKRSDASISFEAKNDGMISSAGYVPKNCMDDCFNGIYISSIEAIQ